MNFAVYGTLKKEKRLHHAMEGTEFLGEFVTNPEYTMYNLGNFPAIVHEGNTSILTEIYRTENESIVNRLFAIEGYNGPNNPRNLYNIETIVTPYGEAIIFVFGNPNRLKDYNTPIIKDGIWK